MADESIVVKTVRECTSQEREAFIALVTKGGEVKPAFARVGMERSRRLSFAFVSGQLAGVACLKQPLDTYRNGVFEKARSSTSPGNFNDELGYVSVEPEFQGRRLSSKLTEALLSGSSTKMFATSAARNARMHATLTRLGFKRQEEAYASVGDPNKALYLFVRQ